MLFPSEYKKYVKHSRRTKVISEIHSHENHESFIQEFFVLFRFSFLKLEFDDGTFLKSGHRSKETHSQDKIEKNIYPSKDSFLLEGIFRCNAKNP